MILNKKIINLPDNEILFENSWAHAYLLVINSVRSKVRFSYFSAFGATVRSTGHLLAFYIHGAPVNSIYRWEIFGDSVGERNPWSAIPIQAVPIDETIYRSAIGMHTVFVDALCRYRTSTMHTVTFDAMCRWNTSVMHPVSIDALYRWNHSMMHTLAFDANYRWSTNVMHPVSFDTLYRWSLVRNTL